MWLVPAPLWFVILRQMSSPSEIRPESSALSKDDCGMSISENPPNPPGPSEQVRAFDQMYDDGRPPWRHRTTTADLRRAS